CEQRTQPSADPGCGGAVGDLLHNHLAIKVALALLVVKAIIWVIALGSGTSGGVLAPLRVALMLGGALSLLLSTICNAVSSIM
ncbi:hypothetical protein NY813_05765, partial [Escherichia coli]|uniref:chloride channel protein n=1 Tax=Escherichia coli TaxID=562 RepID=UPI0022F0AF07